MIAEWREPKGLKATDRPIWGDDTARDRRDAQRGSAKLRDAILLAKGYAPPPKPRKIRTRAQKPIDPPHPPTCCDKCGAPFKPEPRLISNIQAAVAAYYKLDPITMRSARRSRDIAHPRQIAMYLASELTPKSLPDIGRRFGGRDHTTVIHAIRAVKSRVENDPEIALDVALLRDRLAA